MGSEARWAAPRWTGGSAPIGRAGSTPRSPPNVAASRCRGCGQTRDAQLYQLLTLAAPIGCQAAMWVMLGSVSQVWMRVRGVAVTGGVLPRTMPHLSRSHRGYGRPQGDP